MGAALVTRYAAAHPEIRATVAISLGSAADLPEDPARPRNLLVLVGAAEFRGLRDAAVAALRKADPDAAPGVTVGDPARGTARRAVTIGGTEHISVLYAARTHEETARWIATALGVTPRTDAVRPRDRLLPAAALLAAFTVAFAPYAAMARWRRSGAPPEGTARRHRVRTWLAAAGLVVGLAAAVGVAGVVPATWLPLAVAGHATLFFAVAGVVFAACRALDRPRPAADGPQPPQVRGTLGGRIAVGLLLCGYAVVAVVLPAQLGLTHMVPVGARWWLLPVVAVGTFLLLLGVELVCTGAGWRRPVMLVATVGAMVAATLAGLAPRFGLIVLPLLAILLGWQAIWAWWLRRDGAPAWLAAAVGAVVVGWPIAATLPLV
jgi:hypothetical protein